jgi:hypothetical protein
LSYQIVVACLVVLVIAVFAVAIVWQPEQEARPSRRRRAGEAEELRRYADEVAVAAEHAGVRVDRRRAEWRSLSRTQAAAWRAYQGSDLDLRRSVEAAAFALPETEITPAELSARRRYLERAVTDAYARGDLSVDQFGDALAHRGGWDPTAHPFDQQALLCRIRRDRSRRAYDEVTAIERMAWHEVEMAAAAKESLDHEAALAAFRARGLVRAPEAERTVVMPVPAWNADTVQRPALAA